MKPNKTFQTRIDLRQMRGGNMACGILLHANTPMLVIPPGQTIPVHMDARVLGYVSALAADQDCKMVGFVRVEEAQGAIADAYKAGLLDGITPTCGSAFAEAATPDEDAVALEIGRAQLALLRWARESEKEHGKAKARSQKANERAQAFVNAEKKGG
jgi:hypothetical protein